MLSLLLNLYSQTDLRHLYPQQTATQNGQVDRYGQCTASLLSTSLANVQQQDSQRLPSGFERIGYDADSETYTYRGPDGKIYESEPGSRYGELWPVGEPRPQRSDDEIEANNEVVARNNKDAMRMMLPFALLILGFLFLLFKLINRPVYDDGNHQYFDCVEGSHHVQIRRGDTCWAVAQKYGVGVDELMGLGGNENVDCDNLRIGEKICVPKTV